MSVGSNSSSNGRRSSSSSTTTTAISSSSTSSPEQVALVQAQSAFASAAAELERTQKDLKRLCTEAKWNQRYVPLAHYNNSIKRRSAWLRFGRRRRQ